MHFVLAPGHPKFLRLAVKGAEICAHKAQVASSELPFVRTEGISRRASGMIQMLCSQYPATQKGNEKESRQIGFPLSPFLKD